MVHEVLHHLTVMIHFVLQAFWGGSFTKIKIARETGVTGK
jgi:hypothetical protein